MMASSLGRAFGQIGILTAGSRVLGLVRDIVFAIFLGAGPAADAFLVALKLPNMFRRLSAEGALTNAFVPSYAATMEAADEKAARRLAGEVQTLLIMVLLALVIVFEIMMPVVVSLLAPGFVDTPERFAAAVDLARVTMPYLPMISLVAFWAAIANAHDRFIPGAAMPVLFNICLIAGALLVPLATGLTNVERALPIAWALLAAGSVQLVTMYLVLHRRGILPDFVMSLRASSRARQMWRKFIPAAGGALAMQMNLIVDLVLAYMLQVGAISWLYYADRVAQLPLGIVGIALGTALLPRLSKAEAAGHPDAVRSALTEAMELGGFLVVPAVAALLVLALPIVQGLFAHGAFTLADAQMASFALMAYAIGLPGFVLVKILQPAFYAAGQPGLVLRISLVMVAVNIVGSLLLMGPFGHTGLAMATAASGLLAAAIMLVILARRDRLGTAMLRPLARILLASLIMVLALSGLTMWLPFDNPVLRLALYVGGGSVVYFGAAILLRAVPSGLFRRR
ncbi:MAG: murein biosynthesis integral membrane protein MurJ [Alphaproteobacteria bacterium]